MIQCWNGIDGAGGDDATPMNVFRRWLIVSQGLDPEMSCVAIKFATGSAGIFQAFVYSL